MQWKSFDFVRHQDSDSKPHLNTFTMDWLGGDESLSMGTFSWKRWAERWGADSIGFAFSPRFLATFICVFFVWGGFWLWCFSLKYPGFLQLLHRSPSQYKRFADRPRLELDRLPRKKKTLIPSGATNKTALNSYRFCFLLFVWYNSKEKGKYFRIMLTSSFGPWWLVGLMFERRNWW